MSEITARTFERALIEQGAHYNMGHDEHGRRRGYSYGYRFVDHPRLTFIRRVYKIERRETWAWYVDGVEIAARESLYPMPPAVLAALNRPPVVTDEERAALNRLPGRGEYMDLRKYEDVLAGCERPSRIHEVGSPHNKAMILVDWLRAKGLVELGRSPESPDGQPWSDDVPEDRRWSPTIRRRFDGPQ